MAEIDVLKHNTPAIVLFNAICNHAAKNEIIPSRIREVFGMDETDNTVDVKLTVNGIEIPFEQTVQGMWDQVNRDHDERALVLAKEIVAGAGLQDLFDRIRDAEWSIGSALEQALQKLNKDK